MTRFSSKEFINELSEDLIVNFDRASRGTTPGLKGSARETEVRSRLENALPSGIGVGTGCVIDHLGNASNQQDIILFEKDICPKYSLNNTPETTYYPCEGVIAVGEVKSTIGKKEIEDGFKKIQSVKKLKRLAIESKSLLTNEMSVDFRKYLSVGAFAGTKTEEFNQDINPRDQIWGFILCGKYSVGRDTLCKHIKTNMGSVDVSLSPNLIVSMHDGILVPYNKTNNSMCYSVADGTGYVYGNTQQGSFEFLLTRIYQTVRSGRTVDVSAFEHYLVGDPSKMTVSVEHVVDV